MTYQMKEKNIVPIEQERLIIHWERAEKKRSLYEISGKLNRIVFFFGSISTTII